MKRTFILLAASVLLLLAGRPAYAQCGTNGVFVPNPFTNRLDCTGKVGAAGYVATITAATTISVTAATHGQGTKPVGFCYDNSTPAVPITLTTNTVAANGDMVFAWSGTKTGYCVISALGNQVGATGPTGPTGPSGGTASFVPSSSYATLALACTAAVSGNIGLLIDKAWTSTPTQTCAANPVQFIQSASVQPAAAQVVTFSGTVQSGAYKIFDTSVGGSSSIAIGPNTPAIYTEWFGAVGDGSTDDITAIQAAINARIGGGIIQFLAKRYVISGALTVQTNHTHLNGFGMESSLVPAQTFSQISSTSTSADMIASINAGAGNCSSITTSTGIEISNLSLTRSVTPIAGSKGINFTRNCWAVARNVEVDQSATGIYVFGSADTLMENIQTYNTANITKYGIEIDSTGTSNASTYVFKTVSSGASGTYTGVYIHGDCVADTDISDAATAGIAYGMQITSTNGGSTYCNGDIHIFRPTWDVIGTAGIVITNLTGTAGFANVEIASAHIDCGGTSAIGVDIESSQGVNLHGSQIRARGSSGVGVLINGSGSANNLIVDNEFNLTKTGISIVGSDSNTVTGNVFSSISTAAATVHASLGAGSDRNVFSENVLSGYATTGILTNATATNNTLYSNSIDPTNITTPITNNGTGNLFGQIARGSSALGTSLIASGNCASVVTVSTPGVLTTDTVLVGFNGDPFATTGYIPGAMLSLAGYPTAGNINIKVCNGTASSITPSAVTVNWTVIR